MIKNILPVVALIGAVLFTAPVLAETTPATPAATAAANPNQFPPAVVAVVDIERILKDSAAGKSVRTQLDARRTKYQDQATADQKKLEAEQADIIKQRATLTAEQFATKRTAFEQKARTAQQSMQDHSRDLDVALGEALATIKKSVGQIVADIAASKGATVVLDKSQVIVVEAKLDLTDAVLAQLDQKLPRVTLRAEGAAAPRAQANGRH